MALQICQECQRPFLTNEEYCPNCPEPYSWNQESRLNLGCLALTIVPLFLMIFFWIFLFVGIIFH